MEIVRSFPAARAAHLLFLVGWFLLIFPKERAADLPALLIALLLLSGYAFLVLLPARLWTRERYLGGLLFLLAVTLGSRLLYPDFPDHRIFWPFLYLAATAESGGKRGPAVLAAATLTIITGMLLSDGFSFGAWLAAFLVYGTLRSQALLRKAHRTNREQLRQLEAAHAELYRSSVQAMGYAALTERTRLARDIHDGLGHRLTSLIVQLQALRLTIGRDATKSAEMVEDLLDTARQGMQEVRMAVKEWSDDDSRLGAAALKGLVSQTEARTRLAIRYEERGLLTPWPEEHGIILYRVLQEALTNILKHAEAKQAVVRVEETGRELTLTVRDDGSYRAQEPLEPGFGLRGMKERCEAAGGRLVFRALSPHGLELETRLPLAHDDEGERYHGRTG